MNKKLMAAAVAGVLVAPAAFAQSSNVQLYGRVNTGLSYWSSKGAAGCNATDCADREGRLRIIDNSSRVGIRGTEDLGNGLKAIFQIESGVNTDTGSNVGQGGQTNGSTGFWGTRTTFGGLQGSWGRATFGRQNIYWVNGVNAPFAGAWINQEVPWTNGTNLGRVSNGGIITARVSNTFQYTSPTWAGNNFTLSWSAANRETVQDQLVGGVTTDADSQVLGATWRGTFGPVYAQIDFAAPSTNTVSGFQKKGTLWKAGLGWGYMPGARVSIIGVQTEQNAPTGLNVDTAGLIGPAGMFYDNKVKKTGWTVNWYHTFGNIQAMAQYGMTGDLKGCMSFDNTYNYAGGVTPSGSPLQGTGKCNSSSAKAFMVGARYLMSKRTWLYLTYMQVTNEDGDYIDFTGAAQTSVGPGGTTPYGADPKMITLGFFHHF